MAEIKRLGTKTYYVTGMFHVGIYVIGCNKNYSGKMDVCLIDSGLNSDIAATIDKLLISEGFRVKLIINTHYHADHSGGNSYFYEKYHCDIISTKLNAAMISNYDVCPAMLWGAAPIRETMTDYFYTASTNASDIDDYILPDGLTTVSLHGHCVEMIGIKTSDDVFFVGDAVVSENTLAKNSLTYIYDIEEHLKTLDRLEHMKASIYVPYHAEPTKDIVSLVEANRKSITNVLWTIRDICETPSTFDEIYSTIYTRSGYTTTLYRYVVEGSILKGYLSYMYNNGEIETVITGNYIKWHTVS